MGNQQPSSSDPINFLARNAVLGDGYLWKHPECKNYKGIWTSTTPELLELKRSMAPDIFTTGVRPATTGNGRGRFANAKPLYRLASVVHPVFTQHKELTKETLFDTLNVKDFALWYLDDGCCVKRNDSGGHRFTLSVGDCADTPEKKRHFEATLQRLFGDKFGRVYKNNSQSTEKNKVWIMTKQAAQTVLSVASVWKVLPRKFPS